MIPWSVQQEIKEMCDRNNDPEWEYVQSSALSLVSEFLGRMDLTQAIFYIRGLQSLFHGFHRSNLVFAASLIMLADLSKEVKWEDEYVN